MLAQKQIQYEVEVEDALLRPLTDLESDYKNVAKSKKQLQKLYADQEDKRKKYVERTNFKFRFILRWTVCFVFSSTHWIGWLIDYLFDWLVDWLIDWLIDWFL